ncbi:MAG TPA: RNA polymerase sigma factor [Candidatus Limnocylindrales bacterium]
MSELSTDGGFAAASSGGPAVAPVPRDRPAHASRVALVERAMEGDRLAFEWLVEDWIEPAYRTALAILGGDADARDATQEALVQAWRGIRGLRDPGRFDAWLGRIQVNACRGIGRRRGRSSVREIPLSALAGEAEPASPSVGVEEESTSLDELERAFERLSVAERTILVLHHLEAQPVSRIAATLGIPIGTAQWRLHAARQALAKALERERREEERR